MWKGVLTNLKWMMGESLYKNVVNLRRHMRPHQLWDLQTGTVSKLRSGTQNSQSLAKVSVASDGRFTLPWCLHEMFQYVTQKYTKWVGWFSQCADSCRLCILQFVNIMSHCIRHKRSYSSLEKVCSCGAHETRILRTPPSTLSQEKRGPESPR